VPGGGDGVGNYNLGGLRGDAGEELVGGKGSGDPLWFRKRRWDARVRVRGLRKRRLVEKQRIGLSK